MFEPSPVICGICTAGHFYVELVGGIPAAINVVLTCYECGDKVNVAVLPEWKERMEEAF